MFKLYFASEARFVNQHGIYYSLGGFDKTLWNRYLEYFDYMIIIARVSYDDNIKVSEAMRVADKRISFIDLPYYIGFAGYFKQRGAIQSNLNMALKNDGIYICRLPGSVGSMVIKVLNRKKISYACEVVGNPWDVFAKGSVDHPLRPIIRRFSTYQMKKQLKRASAALYVTQSTLQKMYPVKSGVFNIGVSDVIIKDSSIVASAKVLGQKKLYKLISIGSLSQMYKAPDVVLNALKIINEKGVNCELIWLGDGAYLPLLEKLALNLSIKDKVHFIGSVPPNQVIKYLRESDIFLLVSRTEGLPRAIIEAMAQGLPCIGSRVGGIPELLTEHVLVKKDDVRGLVNLLQKMLSDYQFTNNQAEHNLKEAQNYKESVLNERRRNFYDEIKKNNEN